MLLFGNGDAARNRGGDRGGRKPVAKHGRMVTAGRHRVKSDRASLRHGLARHNVVASRAGGPSTRGTADKGTSEQVPRGLRCGQNADECEARDEGRSLGYDAEEPKLANEESGAAFCRNPDGTGLFGRSALSRSSSMGPAIGFASLRAAHPEKPPSQPC